MKIVIKEFTELTTQELYEILQLRVNVFVLEQQCFYPEIDGRDYQSYHLYLENFGRIQGYLRIPKKGQTFDTISIGRLVVHPDYRGIGLAAHMMDKALMFITEHLGETHIKISAQQYLVSFYEKKGFRAISEGYLEDGIPHVDMEYKV